MENGYIRPGGGKESFMDGLKKAYYRTYQQVFDIGMRCLHWRKPIVISGAGCIRQVPDVLSKSGVTKVMVVTGSHVVKSLGPKLFAALEDAGMPYEVFSEVEANPSVNTVEKIRAQYLETGCSGFVALGGGSPMDATKGAAARVACPKKACDDMAGVMRVGKTAAHRRHSDDVGHRQRDDDRRRHHRQRDAPQVRAHGSQAHAAVCHP